MAAVSIACSGGRLFPGKGARGKNVESRSSIQEWLGYDPNVRQPGQEMGKGTSQTQRPVSLQRTGYEDGALD